MERRTFGHNTFKVSALGFGAGNIGAPKADEKALERLLNEAIDRGVILFDTARSYGLSEERIGKYLSHRRNEFILSTKVGYGVEGFQDWTYDCVVVGVKRALQVMKTEMIDIVHLHSCSSDILQNNGVIDALALCRERGLIRSAAYSGENEDLQTALLSPVIDSIQCSVNICDQNGIEQFAKPASAVRRGVIAKRAVANAVWKYTAEPQARDLAEYWRRWKALDLTEADTEGIPLNELFIRFAAFAPGVQSCLAGISSLQRLNELVNAVEQGPLPASVLKRIRDKFASVGISWRGIV